jgi:CxxC-x17-CxxC domain-containing protein
MPIEDKELQCADCGAKFTFTTREQEFFKTKGYTNEPKRCPTCRESRKTERYGSGSNSGYRSSGPRQMFQATCAECGKATEVPFEPKEGRPVYCRDCYDKVKVNRR